MAEMGKYCKAYLAKQFREYLGWTEYPANTRKEMKDVDGKEVEVERVLDDDSILYLQENYIVTDDIFKDENVIFDNVTDDWKQFCHEKLAFEIPVYDPINIPSPPLPPRPSFVDADFAPVSPIREDNREGGDISIAVAWDPDILSEENYGELIVALGDLVRSEGGIGVRRVVNKLFGVNIEAGVLV